MSGQGLVRGILVVEDEPLVRDMLEEALEDVALPITVATNGDEALALLDGGLSPRMLITNVRMPGEMDGLALARRLRQRQPDVAVIVISGDTAYIDETDGLRDAHLLRKPFRVPDLLGVVQRLLAKQSA